MEPISAHSTVLDRTCDWWITWSRFLVCRNFLDEFINTDGNMRITRKQYIDNLNHKDDELFIKGRQRFYPDMALSMKILHCPTKR